MTFYFVYCSPGYTCFFAISDCEALLKYQAEHMRFVTDFEVAFDNNTAERAIQMTKTKMKFSVCFRSELSMGNFFIIRSPV
ncbi:MAG: IS66 family transposase [Culicoidibacterales bacterium]